MRRSLFLKGLTVSFALITISACSSARIDLKTPFDNLIGKWAGTLGEGIYYENWEKNSGSYLQGEAFWVKGQDTVLAEDLRLQKMGNYWTYIAMINQSRPVLFTLIRQDNRQWIFENKEHDYPQVVGYRLVTPDSLAAWTDGEINGNFRKNEYMLTRQK